MRWIAIAMLACGLTGCTTAQALEPPKLVGSDFCQIVNSKLRWSVHDTPATIDEINRLNIKWDRRCGTPGGAT